MVSRFTPDVHRLNAVLAAAERRARYLEQQRQERNALLTARLRVQRTPAEQRGPHARHVLRLADAVLGPDGAA